MRYGSIPVVVGVLMLPVLLAQLPAARAKAQKPARSFSPEQIAFFEKNVRPVLVEKCVPCHAGNNAGGGVKLDTRDNALASLAIDSPDKGKFLHAIRYNGKIKMPPSEKLRDTEIAALAAWVSMGAPWPQTNAAPKPSAGGVHWAFVAPKKTLEPPVEKSGIDAFVLAGLAKKNLSLAPRADRRTMLRRLNFDLIGLPPTPAEMDAFLADSSAGAYAKVVDRLLADPRFGERWARHWLDVARYADSNGLDENLAYGNAWRYRDWVVDALNGDLPYDQFLTEQIAGDLMPTTDPDEKNRRLVATGYLTLGPKVLAEQDKPKLVMDIVDEQIEVVSKSAMALTVACARCHDHKFDPIATKDYYALAGIFKSTKTMANLGFVSRWNERALGSPELTARLAAFEKDIAPLKAEVNAARKAADSAKPAGALIVDAAKFVRGNVNVGQYGDGVINSKDSPTVVEWEIDVATPGKYRIEMRRAAQESRPANFFVNGKRVSGKAGDGETGGWSADDQGWVFVGNATLPAGKSVLKIERSGPIPHISRLAVLPDGSGSIADGDARLSAATKALKDAEAKRPETPQAMAVEDGAPEDVKVHIRGDILQLGDTVKRGFVAVLCGGTRDEIPAGAGSGRLEFARWLTRKNHPLTSRVAVNRVWHHLFGHGIVRTPDNFGIMGERPTNLELLDYLAITFEEDDSRSIKKLIRRIVLTDTYRQASLVENPTAALADPENRLLWKQNRRRLEAEPLRDSLLAVSGTLDPTRGGTLLTTKNGDYVTNDQSADQGFYGAPRRSLYLPLIRNAMFDYFQAFDVGDPSMVNASRASTTVAPQALFLMNSPLIREQSRAFAVGLLKSGALSDADRIARAYGRALQRKPFPAEIARAETFLRRVDSLLAGTELPAKERQERAWAALCQTLLASNEFVYVD